MEATDISFLKRILEYNHSIFISSYFFAVSVHNWRESLDYNDVKRNEYAHQLEGIDRDFVQSGNITFANYPNLSSGEYLFKVIASNNDGVWNRKGISLKIIINPPFWRTWWAYTGYILIAFFSVTGAYRYRVRSLKQQKIELEKQVNEKTKQLQESEAKLQILNANKDKFFSIISHDLKNVSNASLTFSELLVDFIGKASNEKIKEYSVKIHESVKLLYTFLTNLLSWARLQSGQFTPNPIPIDLQNSINDIFKTISGNALRKSIILEVEVLNDLKVFADPVVLSSVLQNIITNAIKFTKTGGVIKVSAARFDDKYIAVSVKDNGIGFPKELREKIFDINIKHTSTGTNNEHGTGLGLKIVKEMVDKLDGKIWIESEEGKGSTFTFTVPYFS